MAVLPALAGPTIKILSPIAAAGTTGRVYLALNSCCVAAVPPRGLVIAVTGLVIAGVLTVIAVCSESSYRRQAQRCCPSVLEYFSTQVSHVGGRRTAFAAPPRSEPRRRVSASVRQG